MILSVAGLLLAALGLFAGVLLVAAPLGVAPANASLVLWALFPVFTLAGFTVFVMGARTQQLRGPTVAVSWLLLLLAFVAAAALLLDAAGIRPAQGGTAVLWYVMAGAGLLGLVGAAGFGRPRADA